MLIVKQENKQTITVISIAPYWYQRYGSPPDIINNSFHFEGVKLIIFVTRSIFLVLDSVSNTKSTLLKLKGEKSMNYLHRESIAWPIRLKTILSQLLKSPGHSPPLAGWYTSI